MAGAEVHSQASFRGSLAELSENFEKNYRNRSVVGPLPRQSAKRDHNNNRTRSTIIASVGGDWKPYEKKVRIMAQEDRTSKRGFASMDEEKQREIARKGGASVPDEERSFSRDHDLAAAAGKKGGQESGGNFRNDPKRAAEAGRKGGQH